MIRMLSSKQTTKVVLTRVYECDSQMEYRAVKLQQEKDGFAKVGGAIVGGKLVATYKKEVLV